MQMKSRHLWTFDRAEASDHRTVLPACGPVLPRRCYAVVEDRKASRQVWLLRKNAGGCSCSQFNGRKLSSCSDSHLTLPGTRTKKSIPWCM